MSEGYGRVDVTTGDGATETEGDEDSTGDEDAVEWVGDFEFDGGEVLAAADAVGEDEGAEGLEDEDAEFVRVAAQEGGERGGGGGGGG